MSRRAPHVVPNGGPIEGGLYHSEQNGWLHIPAIGRFHGKRVIAVCFMRDHFDHSDHEFGKDAAQDLLLLGDLARDALMAAGRGSDELGIFPVAFPWASIAEGALLVSVNQELREDRGEYIRWGTLQQLSKKGDELFLVPST